MLKEHNPSAEEQINSKIDGYDLKFIQKSFRRRMLNAQVKQRGISCQSLYILYPAERNSQKSLEIKEKHDQDRWLVVKEDQFDMMSW